MEQPIYKALALFKAQYKEEFEPAHKSAIEKPTGPPTKNLPSEFTNENASD